VSKLDRRLFVKFSLVAFLLEALLLAGLIHVQPHAGPHQTSVWLLVLAQLGGVMAAAAFVAPLKAQLGPFFFECTYYGVVFVTQMAILEIIAFGATKVLRRGSTLNKASPTTSRQRATTD
jgi:hypothetical protein